MEWFCYTISHTLVQRFSTWGKSTPHGYYTKLFRWYAAGYPSTQFTSFITYEWVPSRGWAYEKCYFLRYRLQFLKKVENPCLVLYMLGFISSSTLQGLSMGFQDSSLFSKFVIMCLFSLSMVGIQLKYLTSHGIQMNLGSFVQYLRITLCK